MGTVSAICRLMTLYLSSFRDPASARWVVGRIFDSRARNSGNATAGSLACRPVHVCLLGIGVDPNAGVMTMTTVLDSSSLRCTHAVCLGEIQKDGWVNCSGNCPVSTSDTLERVIVILLRQSLARIGVRARGPIEHVWEGIWKGWFDASVLDWDGECVLRVGDEGEIPKLGAGQIVVWQWKKVYSQRDVVPKVSYPGQRLWSSMLRLLSQPWLILTYTAVD